MKWTVVRSAASIPRRLRRAQKGVAQKDGAERCPMCNALVNSARLASHKANRCLKRPDASKEAMESQSRSGTNQKVKLPFKRSVRNYVARSKSERGAAANPSHNDVSIEAMPQVQAIDRMEANRGIGFFARENGRLGSHPLHDRFDDESGPDA